LPAAKIRQLNPTYPLRDAAENSKHWSDHVGVYEDEHARVVTVNSCAAHGYIFEGTPEYERGRFTAEVETTLKNILDASTPKAINLLVTHHHPQAITETQFADNSTMVGGDRLIRLLGQGAYGAWMIIHGHRHVPHFQLGAGDNDRPLVFSAGSLGVILHPVFYPTKPPNQFYVIEFDLTETSARGNGLLGFINAWNWNHGNGWQPAGDSDPIPERSGFGSRSPVSALVRQITDVMKQRALNDKPVVLDEEEVAAACPDLHFTMPSERRRLVDQLRSSGILVGRHPLRRQSLVFVLTAGGAATSAEPA
jgi:hypothetical protein